MLFATGPLVACLAFVAAIILLNRRVGMIERQGIQVSSLTMDREGNFVIIDDMELKLTSAAVETIPVLAEARMDGEVLGGAEIEAVNSGRSPEDCEKASGATRIKRLRDTLGNQVVA